VAINSPPPRGSKQYGFAIPETFYIPLDNLQYLPAG
jgi:hypothetical protein